MLETTVALDTEHKTRVLEDSLELDKVPLNLKHIDQNADIIDPKNIKAYSEKVKKDLRKIMKSKLGKRWLKELRRNFADFKLDSISYRVSIDSANIEIELSKKEDGIYGSGIYMKDQNITYIFFQIPDNQR